MPAEVLSTGAAVAGLAAVSAHVLRKLRNDIRSIKDAPADLQRLETSAQALKSSLASLKALNPATLDRLGAQVTRHVHGAIAACNQTTERFHADLVKHLQAGPGEKAAFRDRFAVGYWKKTEIESILQQFASTQGVVTAVVSSASLQATILSAADRAAEHKMLADTMAQILHAITLTNESMREVERAVREIDHDARSGPQDSTSTAQTVSRLPREAGRTSGPTTSTATVAQEVDDLQKQLATAHGGFEAAQLCVAAAQARLNVEVKERDKEQVRERTKEKGRMKEEIQEEERERDDDDEEEVGSPLRHTISITKNFGGHQFGVVYGGVSFGALALR